MSWRRGPLPRHAVRYTFKPVSPNAGVGSGNVSEELHNMKPYDAERYDTHRKTQFEDGELVLTPQHIILYSSDGNNELRRIPMSAIISCKYNRLRRHLEIKAVKNGNMQRKKRLMQMEDEMRDLYNRKIRYQGRLECAGQKEHSELMEKIEWVEQRAKKLHDEMNHKEITHSKGSEVAETFRLPDSFGKDGWSAGDEYAVWEHIIRRRIQPTPKIRIESSPPGCVVAIEDAIVGTTPINMDAPLLDESIVRGKYRVTLLSENHKKEEFYIPANLAHHTRHTRMTGLNNAGSNTAEPPAAVRHMVHGKYLDDQRTDLHYTLDGGDGATMVLTNDGVLTVATGTGNILYNIPYEHITAVDHKKGFGSTNHIRITYDDPPFFGLIDLIRN